MAELKTTIVKIKPFSGMKPGTSGLRKKTKIFMEENYIETFIQCILSAVFKEKIKGCKLVVGGDGRFYNDQALQKIIQICAANQVSKLYVALNGIMSTPAVSCCIRKFSADGGIILTASHNPGGEDQDFGIKFNTSNGGPAPENLTEKMYELSKTISEYKTCQGLKLDLTKVVSHSFEINGDHQFHVEVIDSVEDYLQLMKQIFDFSSIKKLISSGFKVTADALHGVMGPYVMRILCEELGVAKEDVRNCTPSPDFNKGHPDPNLTYAKSLVDLMQGDSFDFGTAFDGDGDRNMILGRNGFFINPSDSLAILGANLSCVPYFQKHPLTGFARSMPTSSSLDRVAEKQKKKIFVTPTGWKFFGNLMDAGLISLCGEESFGTGSDHIREKDGMWAMLSWLSMLAHQKKSAEQMVKEHWANFGRNFYTRYDYENCESEKANEMMKCLEKKIINDSFKGQVFKLHGKEYTVKAGENFSYQDPVDQSISKNQGLIITFTDNSRIIFRLSGTGVSGATIRMYIDSYESLNVLVHPQDQLKSLVGVALQISQLQNFTGRQKPDVIT